MTSTAENVLFELTELTKIFPNGTVALRGVSMSVGLGSVHGLIGANGAGKSTLIKCMSGVHPPSGGTMRWHGRRCTWRDPGSARRSGLATIHQHLPLVPTLSVLENVFLDRPGPWRHTADMRQTYGELADRLGCDLDPDAQVATLPIGTRQMVAIMQALALGAELVIMDEPTASLSESERRIVLDAVRRLSATGTSVLFISHFLDEILEVSDHVTVLRDGRAIVDAPTRQVTEAELIRSIAGKELLAVEQSGAGEDPGRSDVVLEVRDLQAPVGLRDIGFEVRAGEVLGLAGLLGSGRSEILDAVFGDDRGASGSVRVDGRPVQRSARAAVAAGMAYVPEDRVRQALHGGLPLWKNISLPDLTRLSRGRLVPDEGDERSRARRAVDELGIVTPGVDALPGELSGGNAQKVVFAKWLYAQTRVWLLDEPTAGIDVGAKADLLRLVTELARGGRAVVVACSDFEELLSVANRVLVVRGGRIVAERISRQTTEEELISLAHGLGSDAVRKADHVSSR